MLPRPLKGSIPVDMIFLILQYHKFSTVIINTINIIVQSHKIKAGHDRAIKPVSFANINSPMCLDGRT